MPRRASPTILLSLQLVLVGALAFVFTPFGCALSDTVPKVDAGPQVTCNKGDDAHCQAVETNPCNHDVCNADGICEVDHVSSGAIADTKLGDCHNIVCKNGEPINTIDPTDTEDDSDPCTVDGCSASGTPTHTPIPEGGTCKDEGHAGVCRSGECEIKCSGSDDCKTPDKCAVGACDLGKLLCKFMKLDGVPVPDTEPKVGDCQDLVCVKGNTKSVDNPADLPKVTDCYTPTCTGEPLKPGKAEKSYPAACMSDGGHICDGHGKCVVCLTGADCPDDGVACHTPTCKNNACSDPNTARGPSNRLNSVQVPGDCHQVECDGNGGTFNAVDQSDINDDNNDCTTDTCDAGGGIQHTPKADSTACGNNLTCKGGMCSGCSTVSQCMSSNPLEQCNAPNCVCPGSNSLYTCAGKGKTCGTIDSGCGTAISCAGAKDGNESDIDCGGDASACPTRCPQGGSCNQTSDCVAGDHCVEGVCCETNCTGACNSCLKSLNGIGNGLCRSIAANQPPKSGSSCPANPPCGDTGVCDGIGNCQNTTLNTPCGTTCTMATQTNDQCNGMGACVGGTSIGCAPYQCNGATCGTTCTMDNQCTAGNFCNSGSCGKKANGASCGGDGECLLGNCIDGVCCNNRCTSSCMACNVAGSVGNCAPLPPNTQDSGNCDDSHGGCGGGGCSGCGNQCACDGHGACLLKGGQMCTCDANCATGKCGSGENFCSNGADAQCD